MTIVENIVGDHVESYHLLDDKGDRVGELFCGPETADELTRILKREAKLSDEAIAADEWFAAKRSKS